ncbi:hypothetical protein AMTR_s00034p00101930 [Amborella trichopoda]|uniref:Uncharacterized protein n=1 Tax=Amborella trichopoda TaxID=13333 RepID=W1PVT8_AMBTC|nr:hypothetical protein AMTR_s00034p00101930 [Amborella trichopoda]
MAKVNLVVSEAVDEGPTTVQEEELGVDEASEQHEATGDDEGLSTIGGEEPVLIERHEVIVPDNRDEDIGNEGLNSQEEGPDERSEQPMAIAPDDLDEVVGDEGLNIALGEEVDIDGRLEQPEEGAPTEVLKELVPRLSEPSNLDFEVSPLEAMIAMAIVTLSSVYAIEVTLVM